MEENKLVPAPNRFGHYVVKRIGAGELPSALRSAMFTSEVEALKAIKDYFLEKNKPKRRYNRSRLNKDK